MPVSEDGFPYGSIDVNELDSIQPKSDEAKAAVDALKAERDQGRAAVAADEKRLSEGNRDPFAKDASQDDRDQQGKGTVDQSNEKTDDRPAAKKSASSPEKG
jgi:hypothetical protein